MQHFIYIWRDKSRSMFYIGSHAGTTTDGYLSSSAWLRAEIRYRPADFRRRIICFTESKNEALKIEYNLLSKIKEFEFATKYYNLKQGKPKGIEPWNKGKLGVYTQETKDKMSKRKLGNQHTKGVGMPKSAENARRGALKMSKTITGRRIKVLPDGRRVWYHPNLVPAD